MYESVETAQGSFFQQKSEPASCYTNPVFNEYVDTVAPPADQSCKPITGATFMCPETPSNVCDDTGACQSGCGSYSFDGQTNFVCFANDTDGDGTGDYIDTDIDGDGLINTQDPDVDGDGIPNESDTDYVPPTTTGIDGDGTVNVTVQINEAAIVKGIVDGLTESVDINADAEVALLDQKKTDFESSVDTFMSSEESKLSNIVGETGAAQALNKLTLIGAPKPCNLSFTAPFRGGMTIELCDYIEPLKPILAVFFAFGTFIFGYRRIAETIRGAL